MNLLNIHIKIDYVVHHNWAWAVEEALHIKFGAETLRKHKRSRLLPGVTTPGYSLFRIMFRGTHIRVTDPSFEKLDAKDKLYETIGAFMPKSLLLDIDDFTRSDEIREFIDTNKDIDRGVILKASLGAGGFGLYFCHSEDDVLSVMRSHLMKAKEMQGFLERLEEEHSGTVPRWSLQRVVRSTLVMHEGGLRKSQVRAYLVKCGGHLFVYHSIEVRLPTWASGEDTKQTDQRVAIDSAEFTGEGSAVPYNENRDKAGTMRYLLEELPELRQARKVVLDVMMQAAARVLSAEKGQFSSIAAPFVSDLGKKEEDEDCNHNMAVVGVDLLVESGEGRGTRAYILEYNNNPAMPQRGKHRMSTLYEQHLVALAGHLITLGMVGGLPEGEGEAEGQGLPFSQVQSDREDVYI